MKKIHQYHSQKNVRITVDAKVLLAVAMLGTSFVLGMFFSH